MGEVILVYSLLDFEGEQEFRTFDYDVAREMAQKYRKRVVSRRYRFESGRIVRNRDDADREIRDLQHK